MESPFESIPHLTESTKKILQAVWSTEIERFDDHEDTTIEKAKGIKRKRNARHRPYQSDLSQDEQQRIIGSMSNNVSRCLCSDSIARLRALCVHQRQEGERNNKIRKESLRWALNTDVILRASGELPLALKVIIDAREAASTKRNISSLSQIADYRQLDSNLVKVEDLSVYDRALLSEVVEQVKKDGKPQTMLVLVFILIGRLHWPHQEYDTHVTKLTINPDMTAYYEDHAMSESTRRSTLGRFMYYRSKGKGRGKMFVDPPPIISHANKQMNQPYGSNDSLATYESSSSSLLPSSSVSVSSCLQTKRPNWASLTSLEGRNTDEDGEVIKLPLSNRWCVRLYDSLQVQLQACENISLTHTQTFEYQAWNVSQCALAMLFDVHVNIPDEHRKQVCHLFTKHLCHIPQHKKLSKKLEDKSGNNTMLCLYEMWLYRTHRHVFKEAEKWCIDNSLRVGDFLSAGCCLHCDQFDSPGAIMLCEVDSCPNALHYFCSSQPLYDKLPTDAWYCFDHRDMAVGGIKQ